MFAGALRAPDRMPRARAIGVVVAAKQPKIRDGWDPHAQYGAGLRRFYFIFLSTYILTYYVLFSHSAPPIA